MQTLGEYNIINIAKNVKAAQQLCLIKQPIHSQGKDAMTQDRTRLLSGIENIIMPRPIKKM